MGPVFKRAFSDDVERRSTAFLPASLDNLTAIELPRNEERWIRVDLSEQQVVAYEGIKPIRAFIISSGLPGTPTPEGQFRIWVKFRYDDMAGADYYLEDVPWVMYLYRG